MAKTAIRRRVKKNKSRKNKRRTMRYMGGDSLTFVSFRNRDYKLYYYIHPDGETATVVNFKTNDVSNINSIDEITDDKFTITKDEIKNFTPFNISNADFYIAQII